MVGDDLEDVSPKVAHVMREAFAEGFEIGSGGELFEILAQLFEAGGGGMSLADGIFGGASENGEKFADHGEVVGARGFGILSKSPEGVRPGVDGGGQSRRRGIEFLEDMADGGLLRLTGAGEQRKEMQLGLLDRLAIGGNGIQSHFLLSLQALLELLEFLPMGELVDGILN